MEYALAAERTGWSQAWTTEYHFAGPAVCPSAVTLAAHLLGRTTRLRVGTGVCVLGEDVEMGAVVSATHRKRVLGFLHRAKGETGVELLAGGGANG